MYTVLTTLRLSVRKLTNWKTEGGDHDAKKTMQLLKAGQRRRWSLRTAISMRVSERRVSRAQRFSGGGRNLGNVGEHFHRKLRRFVNSSFCIGSVPIKTKFKMDLKSRISRPDSPGHTTTGDATPVDPRTEIEESGSADGRDCHLLDDELPSMTDVAWPFGGSGRGRSRSRFTKTKSAINLKQEPHPE